MVAARGHAEGGEEKSWEWGGESSWSSTTWSAAQGTRQRAGHVATVEARGVHARRPRRQAVEQVAGTGVDMVERRFGPVTGRFGPWAQNEVFYTQPALHFSLRDQGHLSNGLAVN